MVRQRNVNHAYTPLNRPASSSNGLSKFFAAAAFATFVIFFLSMGGSKSADDDNSPKGIGVPKDVPHPAPVVASKAGSPTKSLPVEPKPTVDKKPATNASPKKSPVAVAPVPMTGTKSTGQVEDENTMVEVMEEAKVGIQQTEDATLEKETTNITSTTTSLVNNIRVGLGRLFGATLNNDELEGVAEEVETQLSKEANTTLRARADNITKLEIKELESMATEDNAAPDIVHDAIAGVETTLEREIDTEATKVKGTLKKRSAEIEKAILEERLSKKFGGKKVTIIVEGDEVKSVESDDDVMVKLGQPKTKAAPPTPAPKKKHHMNGKNGSVVAVAPPTLAPKGLPKDAVTRPMAPTKALPVPNPAIKTLPVAVPTKTPPVAVSTKTLPVATATDDGTDDGAAGSANTDDGANDDTGNDDEGDDARKP